jgi:hypothetical protein
MLFILNISDKAGAHGAGKNLVKQSWTNFKKMNLVWVVVWPLSAALLANNTLYYSTILWHSLEQIKKKNLVWVVVWPLSAVLSANNTLSYSTILWHSLEQI